MAAILSLPRDSPLSSNIEKILLELVFVEVFRA
jgi:hypothetical protein